MSKPPPVQLPPPATIDIDHVPRYRGKEAAQQWYANALGISISLREITVAANSRALGSFLIGGAIHFSSADLWSYISSKRRASTETVSA